MADDNITAIETEDQLLPQDEELVELDEGDEPIDEDPADEDVEAHETVVETPPPPQHPPELVDQAHANLFSAAEIASMTTDALRTAVNAAKRVGQTVYESMATQRSAAPEPKEEETDPFAPLANEEKYDQTFVQPVVAIVKAELAKVRDENKKLRELAESLKQDTAQTKQAAMHARLMANKPDVAKHFDQATPDGQAKYRELLGVMGGLHNANKQLSEKQLFERAIKALDVPIEAPKDPDAERKAKWDGAALGKPNGRATAKTTADKVQEVLDRARTRKTK